MNLQLWTYRFQKYKRLFGAASWAIITSIPLLFRQLFGQKIVVIVLSEQFGDIVAIEPLARGIRKAYPKAHLLWVVKSPFAQVIDMFGYINQKILIINTLQRIFLIKTLAFAKVFNLHLSDNHHPDLLQRHQNPAADALGINVFNYLNHGNLLNVFSTIAGITPPNDFPTLTIPPPTKHKIDTLALASNTVVVHCHSNYTPKDWQDKHWQKLIEKLIEKGFFVVEIGLNSSLNIVNNQYQNLCGKLSLAESAELISRAKFFVGIDSGPAHFANAFGVFGFILQGKLNNFEVYNVYSGHYTNPQKVCIINNPNGSCSELNFEDVWQKVDTRILG